jgi:hypothetical protein
MNLKTTLALVVLAAACAGGWFYFRQHAPAEKPSETIEALTAEIKPENLSRIEIAGGERTLVLERGGDGQWSLPGHWPTRKVEVNGLVELLTGLHPRFAPESLRDETAGLTNFGLDPSQNPVKVTVRCGGREHRLLFGEKSDEGNRFSRPTYLRLDDRPEVVRLTPNLRAALTRPPDYYQQRRLFEAERVKEPGAADKAERLAARSVAAQSAGVEYTLTRTEDGWEMAAEGVRDRPDPDRLKAILAGLPDVWAEQFIDSSKKDPAEFGLAHPEQTVRVTGHVGSTVTLLIGKPAPSRTRTVMRQTPGGPPGLPPQPRPEVVHDEYRYAKLADNDQVFEIKAERLKDVFVTTDNLRDARLVRFRPEDVRRVEIAYGGQEITLIKKKDAWKLQKPLEADAESGKVLDLLDRLSNLQARGPDVLDSADPKDHGLDPPAGTLRVTAEESKVDGETSDKTEKTYGLLLGKRDAEKEKLYVKLEGWPRINAVEDKGDKALTALAKRPALAYRGRKVFDFLAGDVARLEVERSGEKYALQRDKDKGTWTLIAPTKADTDAGKVSRLVDDLGRLEAVEYVNENPKPEELEKEYGLAPAALSATVAYAKEDKPPQTLQVGKQRGDKPEFFARLASAPAVFVIGKAVRDDLGQSSLALRPLGLWEFAAADVTDMRVQKEGRAYRLKRDGTAWKIVEPFEAPAAAGPGNLLAAELAGPKVERFEAHVAKDLATYGLDKPALRVAVTARKPKEPDAKEETAEHVLLIGKPTAEGAATRFARLADGEAVFVAGEKTLAAADKDALDFLDRKLLGVDAGAIDRIAWNGAGQPLTLTPDADGWRAEAPAATFPADAHVMAGLLRLWSDFRAEHFAAYGPQADAAAYGLDKPERTIQLTLKPPEAGVGEKPAEKSQAASAHTLALGKALPDKPDSCYARLDNGPGIAVLGPEAVRELKRTYLDFVDHTVFKLDAGAVTTLARRMGAEELTLARRDGAWQVVKPAEQPADGPATDMLVGQLATLRAARVAAYPVKELAPFGLEEPAAVVTLRLGGADGQSAVMVLRVGKEVESSPPGDKGERYGVAEGGSSVVVLRASLVERLLAPPLQFRDRTLARLGGVDQATLERGPRMVTFAKTAGSWKMTAPVEANVEPTELEGFLGAFAKLRADELVAERPADLKPFGLDQPVARWALRSDGQDVLVLLVGAEESPKEGQGGSRRRYGKLTGGDLVFLLDRNLSSRALAEYRSRSVWPALDAAQVETVRFDPASHPFTLTKAGGNWSVEGQPGAKVRGGAVSETLDALARLRAQRYVVDKDADLKLYGLEPPRLVLTIESPSGNRSLHLGRTEGDSKRFYARVPGEDRTDVFVIAEADAALIVRDLEAFLQPADQE